MNINNVLEKPFEKLDKEDIKKINEKILYECSVERKNNDRKGLFSMIQKDMAYNSGRIEGSKLTPDQTASLFEKEVVYNEFLMKDIEETRGHFLMVNYMLDTINEPLTEDLIKNFHYQLKAGVFEDRANGYAIGDYKRRANMVGNTATANPLQVRALMPDLMGSYEASGKELRDIVSFHISYEIIHPFQDGNGRTGRAIMFRECLKNNVLPFIIKDGDKKEYIECLKNVDENKLENFAINAQKEFYEQIKPFIYCYEQELEKFENSLNECETPDNNEPGL